MKNKLSLILLGFAFGALVMVFMQNSKNFNDNGRKITYLQKLEINDYSPALVNIKGTYLNNFNDIEMITLECNLINKTCIESNTFITKEGIAGMVPLKEYEIIEQTQTRIVAKFEGTSAFHMYTIDLATKKVTFKNEANNNPNDVAVYELEDGATILSKLKK